MNAVADLKTGFEPKDGNECMDEGRKLDMYEKDGRLHVRPVIATWGGDPHNPVCTSSRPVEVNDRQHQSKQHLRPHEAELLHAMLKN